MRVKIYNTIQNDNKIPCLVKEKDVNYNTNTNITSPQEIWDFVNNVFALNRQTEEYVYLLCFDYKMHLLGTFQLSHGAVNFSVCSPREIFMKVLLCGASNYCIIHNHPSGDSSPSADDSKVYDRLKAASEIMNIAIMDSIIVAASDYYSFKENAV